MLQSKMALEGGNAVDSLLQASVCSVNPLEIADVSTVTEKDVKAAGTRHVMYLHSVVFSAVIFCSALLSSTLCVCVRVLTCHQVIYACVCRRT